MTVELETATLVAQTQTTAPEMTVVAETVVAETVVVAVQATPLIVETTKGRKKGPMDPDKKAQMLEKRAATLAAKGVVPKAKVEKAPPVLDANGNKVSPLKGVKRGPMDPEKKAQMLEKRAATLASKTQPVETPVTE